MDKSLKDCIMQALSLTLVGDNEKIAKGSKDLAELQKNSGFCIALMEIVDDPSNQVHLKQAALVQLKNNIKLRWRHKNQTMRIHPEQKTLIQNSLVIGLIRCAKDHRLIKIYREIISIVVSYEYQNWLPVNQILAKLQRNEDTHAVLHCVIGISSNFELSVHKTQQQVFNNFLKAVLPTILKVVAANNMQDSQLVYLALKVLWKTVHYDLPQEVKILTVDWMELLAMVISANNNQMHKKIMQVQQRNSPQFYYFHSKKWATRILFRFVQRHAKQQIFGHPKEYNIQFSKNWYSAFGQKFIEIILQQLTVPTIKKVRYFQLKTIQSWVQNKPQMMFQFSKQLQYNILLEYMTFNKQDQTLASQDVIQFLRNQDEPGFNYTNLKRAATDLWITYMQTGSSTNKQNFSYVPGPLFKQNFQFLVSKIGSQNILQKELAMYIFCRIRVTISKVPDAQAFMPRILTEFVVPHLTNTFVLIRSRAHEMFDEYGKQKLQYSVLQKAAEDIFTCLEKDPCPLVKIKAASSFHTVTTHPQAKQLVRPHLGQVFEVYLNLLKEYDLEQLVMALQYIISNFAKQIGPYAINLFKYLSKLFIDMFNKDIQLSENDEYEGQVEMAASQCLKTLQQILKTPLEPQIRQALEPDIIYICQFLFAGDSVDYTQQLMDLMNTYIFYCEKMTTELWFYYQVIIYFLVGIPKDLWSQINQDKIPKNHQKVLENIRVGNNIQYMQAAFPVLRNYLSKSLPMLLAQRQQFKNNVIQMFFYLVGSIYRKHAQNLKNIQDDQEYQETHLDCACMLVVYLLQTYPSQFTKPVIAGIWQFILFNIGKARTVQLKMVNAQMIAVLMWKHTKQYMTLLLKDQKFFDAAFNNILKFYQYCEQPHERKRFILCICRILEYPQRFQQLLNVIPKLFHALLKLVKANCRSRVTLAHIESQNTEHMKAELAVFNNDQKIDEDIETPEDEDDDEDFWDEDYNQRYLSILSMIDELKQFKNVMDRLQQNQSQFFNQLVNQIPPNIVSRASVFLQKAFTYPFKGPRIMPGLNSNQFPVPPQQNMTQ